MKQSLKKYLPGWIFSCYYYSIAYFSALWYGFPSRKMLVIGVTGTKGKTSTANFIWAGFTAAGIKSGIITTANIRIGNEEQMNVYHMTMPGRFAIQRTLAKMVKEGCECCVVETTSEGLNQWRHAGIEYDIAVFTNLTPEHLPSHGGSFENYKKAKGKLFYALSKTKRKLFRGKPFGKMIFANRDSEHAEFFLNFPADKKATFGIREKADFVASSIQETPEGVTFEVDGKPFKLSLLGAFNVYNALPAIVILKAFCVDDSVIEKGVASLSSIPGRMELISEGQSFTLIVDYAHEKESITAVLGTARKMIPAGKKVIILLGAEGGGRDKAKRPIMGELSAKMADYVIVSNVDPYQDDPKSILEDIAKAAIAHGKKLGHDLFVIEDRRQGISKALSIAEAGDIVLITGKGAEQSMILNAGSIPWDDRQVVREEVRKLLGK